MIFYVADGAWWDRLGLVPFFAGMALISMDRPYDEGTVWITFFASMIWTGAIAAEWLNTPGAFVTSAVWFVVIGGFGIAARMARLEWAEGAIAGTLVVGVLELIAGGVEAAWLATAIPTAGFSVFALYLSAMTLFTPFSFD